MLETTTEIVVAEDSPTQALQVKRFLERHGFRVLSAGNGREALSLLRHHRPALVVTDIMMPEMDGYQLCRAIRADERLADLPVILLTSLSDPEDIIKALQCGADGFVTKPYSESVLLARLQNVLANHQLRSDGPEDGSMEIVFAGRRYTLASMPRQATSLLLSIYETTVQNNAELARARDELRTLNERLEGLVAERTGELRAKNEEMRATSQQLWQAAKLATMGELAASIAHELNNPMGIVSLRVESLLSQMPPEDPRRRSLAIIEQEVDRMARLVANLLEFSRRTTRQISTVDLREEIGKTLELIHYHLRKRGIAVVQQFGPDLPMLHADRQQLRQLFLNLFTNASDAMPEGGTLTLRVRQEGPDTSPPSRDGIEHLVVEVADTGVGISPENLARVMEPFFTTKPEGKGTGLGLAICRRIVHEHHGTLDITSQVDIGTVVRVTFPLATGGGNHRHLREPGVATTSPPLD